MRRLAVVALAVALGGCGYVDFFGLFERNPTPQRLYKLETTATQAPGPLKPITVAVGPVTLPGYLTQRRVLNRVRPDQLEAGVEDGWAEPLDRAVPRVIRENLALLLPAEPAAVQAWRRDGKTQYQVIVDIARLDGPLTGELTLKARWRLVDGAGKELASKETIVTRPAGGTYATMAAGVGFVLEGLSRAVATELNALGAK